MTPQINFEKPITATTTDGGTVSFSFDMKIPGHRQIATAIQAISEADASQQSSQDLRKFDALAPGGGIDRSKLKSSSMTVGNY